MNHLITVLPDTDHWIARQMFWVDHLQMVARVTLEAMKVMVPLEVTILLTDDGAMADLNQRFRRKKGPTNVLAFPSLEAHEDPWSPHLPPQKTSLLLGDIALAYETIEGESQAQGKRFEDHLVHLAVHGLLHLLGYDHQTTKQATDMESKEIEILRLLHIENPYGSDD